VGGARTTGGENQLLFGALLVVRLVCCVGWVGVGREAGRSGWVSVSVSIFSIGPLYVLCSEEDVSNEPFG
jgi:hypothetical protein